jgi:hypothetical protein
MPFENRNVFGGRVSIEDLGQYILGALENYGKKQEVLNKSMQQAYQEKRVSPDILSEILSFAPMGAEIKAFHGSPYKFTKFSNEKIGTGQGASVFGRGHYLTDNAEIARDYAEGVARKKTSNIDVPYLKKLMKEREELNKGIKEELEMNADKIKSGGLLPAYAKHKQQAFEQNAQLISAIKSQLDTYENYAPKVYEATIHKGKKPSEYTFLEWDKPIGKEKANQFLKRWHRDPYVPLEGDTGHAQNFIEWNPFYDFTNKPIEEWTGGELHSFLEFKLGRNEKKASDLLHRAGFSGIKYPSGTLSEIKDSPYYNYVVFNPEDIKIEKINDVPIELLGKAATEIKK